MCEVGSPTRPSQRGISRWNVMLCCGLTKWRQSHLKDVRANCFYASLLRMQFTSPYHATSCIEPARCWRNVERYVALVGILISRHGFNSLKCSVTPDFLLIDHFLYRLSTFCENLKKICVVELSFFFQLFCSHIIEFCYCSCTVFAKVHLRGWV